ncbi:hypothetical protein [Streptomyces sp. NPDC050738]|uniref:hypothetical protein n=1 Tax=Streptomyces sp. NPDC050738 TaxID=3154744 RepID=UPI00343B40C5
MNPQFGTERAVAEWLASTLDDPDRAHGAWAIHRVAALPLGREFCVIRLSRELVEAATSSTDPSTISDVLAESLDGPVICDPVCHRYYALVPPTGAAPWPATKGAEWVGEGTVVGIPEVGGMAPQLITYWSVPFVSRHELCDPGLIRDLVLVGEKRLAASL